ncbi:MAG: thioredoxin family protein [Salinisphaera sp.]|nr:thioredoxin family protein [Salinisphaera sp.]MDN5937865.1 thioredoxin family protein [Salinisphaera sp.]
MGIREIAADELPQLVEAGNPLLVEFSKDHCPWCERIVPELERIHGQWEDRLTMVQLRVDQAPELLEEHGIRGTPTLVLWCDGQRLGSKNGFQRAQQIEAFLRHHLG